MARDKGSGSVHYDKGRERWRGTIEVGYTKTGSRRRVAVFGRTKRDALNKLKEKQREILRQGTPAEGVHGSMTVKTWSECWLSKQQTRLSPRSYNATRSQLMTWIVPTIGHMRLDRLAPANIESVSTAILDAGRRTATANRAHRELLHLLRDARAAGYTVADRVLEVRGPGTGKSDRTAIPVVDAAQILKVAAARDDRARWLCAFLQALRPAEALGLTWACVDFENKTMLVQWQLQALPYRVPRDATSGFRIPQDYEVRQLRGRLHLVRPKTRQGTRLIPLQKWVEEALLDWRTKAPRSDNDLVFPDATGGPRDDKRDREEFKALQREAGVEHKGGEEPRFYDLYEARHSAATMLRQTGADDATIISIMGHASILSTRPYLHTDPNIARNAMGALEERLRDI